MTTESSNISLDQLTPEQLKQLNGELRAYADATAEQNKQLRSRVIENDLRAIGLSPSEGLGIAVVESYSGDLTRDALIEFVRDKYKYEPPPTEEQQEETRTSVAAAVEKQAALESSIAGVSGSLEPAPANTERDLIVNKMHDPEAGHAEAQASVAAKLAQLRELNPNF